MILGSLSFSSSSESTCIPELLSLPWSLPVKSKIIFFVTLVSLFWSESCWLIVSSFYGDSFIQRAQLSLDAVLCSEGGSDLINSLFELVLFKFAIFDSGWFSAGEIVLVFLFEGLKGVLSCCCSGSSSSGFCSCCFCSKAIGEFFFFFLSFLSLVFFPAYLRDQVSFLYRWATYIAISNKGKI